MNQDNPRQSKEIKWQIFFNRIAQLHEPPCFLLLHIKENGDVQLVGAITSTASEGQTEYIG